MRSQGFKTKTITCRGGLNLEADPLLLPAGALILCKNFECKVGGGYTRIAGFERFDGQESPSDASNELEARLNIGSIPGSGGILGVWVYKGVTYAFRNSTDGTEALMWKSTAAGWVEVDTGVTLAPGGRYEFKNYNFSGAAYAEQMFGVDGVNDLFSFDGTTFTQLPVTGFTSKPKHLAIHKNRTFLAYPLGQLAFSSVGDPADYDTETGSAGLIATGGEIVGLKTTVGGALAIFMRNRISILYGSTTSELQAQDLREQSEKAGAIEWTIQETGDIIYMDDRGLTSLTQTNEFGNFRASTIDEAVKKYLSSRLDRIITTSISRTKNQYRLFITSSAGTEMLSLTFGAKGIEGYALAVYPFQVTSVCSEEDLSGHERIFAGADNGFVYEIDRGRSFDGDDIESYFKIPFYHYQSPDYRKRFRRAIAGIDSPEAITLKVKPEFNYGNPDSPSHQVRSENVLGGGGQWGLDDWNEFLWSAPIVGKAQADIAGSGENMALLFYHKGRSEPFTVYNVTVHYMIRRMSR